MTNGNELIEEDPAAEVPPAPAEEQEPLNLSTADRKLVTQPYDLGVKGLSSDIESGRIKLSIEYQRKYVWDAGKASRLIESLLLNVPIPVCYFAELEDGSYEVIDGLQRLTTVQRFLENDLKLTGLSVLSELNQQKFEDLAQRDKRRIENRTIRCIVITEESNPDIKFDVFERLNTGAASLTAQELRNSVYRGKFNDSLKRLSKEQFFAGLMGKASNRRMDFEELILRFFALADGLDRYKPPLRQYLNEYVRSHREDEPTPAQLDLFAETCRIVGKIWGETPFRGYESKNPVNKALFDALMVSVAYADHEALLENSEAASQVLDQLAADESFLAAIGRATADRQRMLYRVGAVARKLIGLGVRVDLPGDSSEMSQFLSQRN